MTVRALLGGSLVILLTACGGGGDDDGGQQYDAESLAGTWLLSAQFSWQLDDPVLTSQGEETMRSIVEITVVDRNRAILRSCYPGVGEQQVEVADNQFNYRLFDAQLTFQLVGEGPDSPSIDYVTGEPIIPGPSTTRKVRAEAEIASRSGAVVLQGSARLLRISADKIRVTDAAIRFGDADANTLALECFSEIVQRGVMNGDDAETTLHRVIARGGQDDTLVEIDVQATDRQSTSGASMAYVDLEDSRQLRNAAAVSERVFVTEGARLSFSLPLEDKLGGAGLDLVFDPQFD
jgi:hypothetical protein